MFLMSSVPASAADLAAANLAATQAAANANLDIDSTLREHRVFPPPAEFAAKAHIKSLAEYEALYARSIADPEAFWTEAASELHWFQKWTKVLDWQLPVAKWFVGGKI